MNKIKVPKPSAVPKKEIYVGYKYIGIQSEKFGNQVQKIVNKNGPRSLKIHIYYRIGIPLTLALKNKKRHNNPNNTGKTLKINHISHCI